MLTPPGSMLTGNVFFHFLRSLLTLWCSQKIQQAMASGVRVASAPCCYRLPRHFRSSDAALMATARAVYTRRSSIHTIHPSVCVVVQKELLVWPHHKRHYCFCPRSWMTQCAGQLWEGGGRRYNKGRAKAPENRQPANQPTNHRPEQ
uniref:Putative secreted peptide n=1 Tax=Anopheles braziliensis TaxID=58242 RepID=A0A2M3ZUQ6_9DIPT